MRAVPEPPSSPTHDDDHEPRASLARDGAVTVARPTPSRGLVASVLASARHELGSPLQSIQGFAELLGSEAYGHLSQEQHGFVEHIVQGSIELGALLDACLELTEAEALERPLELARTPLGRALSEALAGGGKSGRAKVELRVSGRNEGARAKLEPATLKRAVDILLTGLTARLEQEFTAELRLETDHACLRIDRTSAISDELMTVSELARQRRTCRSLVWLRLAEVLFAKQGMLLWVGGKVDRAEVRIPLSATH